MSRSRGRRGRDGSPAGGEPAPEPESTAPERHSAADGSDGADGSDAAEESGGRVDRRARGRSRTRGDRRPLRRRPALIAAAAVCVVAAVAALAYFSPLMSVRTVVVSGMGAVSQEQVISELAIPQGEPLLQVDTAAAAARVAGIPRVASVRVQREFPSTIRVTVGERVPVAFFDGPGGTHLVDGDGVDFATEPPPPGLPRLKVANPASGDPVALAALSVLTSLPPQLHDEVLEVSAPSADQISLTLRDKRVIDWGTAQDTPRKAAVALAVLTRPGQSYDVSSPNLPTVK